MLGFQDIDKSAGVNRMNGVNQRSLFVRIDHRVQDDPFLLIVQSFRGNGRYRMVGFFADKVIDLIGAAGNDKQGFLLVGAVQRVENHRGGKLKNYRIQGLVQGKKTRR